MPQPEPVPELDARVAIAVYRWYWYDHMTIDRPRRSLMPPKSTPAHLREELGTSLVPRYSSDWAEAMKVWAYCRDTYGEDRFARALLDALKIPNVVADTHKVMKHVARGLSPEAICEAALDLAEEGQEEPTP